MKYEDLVKKLKNKENVTSTDVDGVQVFMLLHDRLIKTICIGSALYEINFIPIEYSTPSTIYINLTTCSNYHDTHLIFKRMLDLYENHEPVYIHLQDEFFEIKIEVLES